MDKKISNPNLLRFQSQSARTPNSGSIIFQMRHLTDPNQTEEIKTSVPPRLKLQNAVKTEMTNSQEEANQLFGITDSKDANHSMVTQVSFFEPNKDLDRSALVVVFVLTHIQFFETLFDIQRENEVAKVSISQCLNILDCVLHKPARGEQTRKSTVDLFISNMQLLGISISVLNNQRSPLLMKQVMQKQLDKEEAENFIIEFGASFIPPNEIELKSPLLALLPPHEGVGNRKFRLIWCLLERNSFIYPAIVEDDYEVCALYKSELFTRFGSIHSCLLSGSKMLYACYSSSTLSRPILIPYEK